MPQRDGGGSELLDWLAAECGCGYLSDLRIAKTAPALAQAVKRIPRGAWPAQAWQETARYITGKTNMACEEDESRAALARWLQNQ